MEFSSVEGGGYLTSPRLATCLGSGGACLVTPLVKCLEGLALGLESGGSLLERSGALLSS